MTSQQSGFSDQTTMLQVLNSGGGGKIALGRQSVAALLDVGQFNVKYHFPTGSTNFTTLKTLIANTYKGTSGVSVNTLDELDAANNQEAGTNGFC